MTTSEKTAMGGTSREQVVIAGCTVAAISISLFLRFITEPAAEIYGLPLYEIPLIATLACGGLPLIFHLLAKLCRGEFGSDLLAGISIVTSALLGEYLAGSLVVLMLSGGEALEVYAVRSASSVLQALAKRMPSVAHRKLNGGLTEAPLEKVAIGDVLVVFPHELCPVDATNGT